LNGASNILNSVVLAATVPGKAVLIHRQIFVSGAYINYIPNLERSSNSIRKLQI